MTTTDERVILNPMKPKMSFFDPNITRKEKLVKAHLSQQGGREFPIFSFIEFNLCGLCNRSCVFCPRSTPSAFPNVDEHLDLKLYKKVMESLEGIGFDGTIIYSAFSEPLLYKHLEDAIRISRERCPKARIEIVSNGDFVTAKKLASLFSLGLTVFCISMYDGPHQMDRFKKMQREAGLRDEQLILRVRWLSSEELFGITLSNRAGALNLKEIGVAPLKEPMKKACYYPFYQILIDYDGSVLLCAHDWARRLIVGNVNDKSILVIWNNGILKRVRLALGKESRDFSPCNLCDVKGVLIGRKHFDRWMAYYGKGEPVKK